MRDFLRHARVRGVTLTTVGGLPKAAAGGGSQGVK